MDGVGGHGSSTAAGALDQRRHEVSKLFQYYLDKSTPHALYRWIGTSVLAFVFALRIYYAQGFYIIVYGLGIYILNLLIGFLSPLVDPEVEPSDGPMLPTKGSDEFKPFIRRLPEFKFCYCGILATSALLLFHVVSYLRIEMAMSTITMIHFLTELEKNLNIYSYLTYYASVAFSMWYAITKAFCVAFFMTIFSVFDVPVFWPILLCYWIVLFVLTMKRQIMHMIKYGYIPFNIGKQKYSGKKASASTSISRAD